MSENEHRPRRGRFRIRNSDSTARKIKRITGTIQPTGDPIDEELDMAPGPPAVYLDWPPLENISSIHIDLTTENMAGEDSRVKFLTIDELNIGEGIDFGDVVLDFPNSESHHSITLTIWKGTDVWSTTVDMDV